MPALVGALLGRLVLAQLVVCAALSVLVGAAALIEGHPPDLWRLRAVALGGGAALGAAWVLAAFRREGGDVALAALGIQPLLVALLGLGTATPALALAGGRPAAGSSFVTADRIQLPAGEVRWDAGVAHRSDEVGEAARFPGFPAPTSTPTSRFNWLFPARIVALGAALAWLARRLTTPDVPATLAAGTAATLLGLAPALIP